MTKAFVDLHTDLINIFPSFNMDGNIKADFSLFKNDDQINIDLLKKSNTRFIFSSSFGYYESPEVIGKNFFDITLYSLYLNKKIVEDNSKIFTEINNFSDIEKVMNSEKIGYIQHLEGIYGVNQLWQIDMLADLGIKSMGITWNVDNNIASSCREGNNYGLTQFGKKVIKHMENKGIIIDLAHIGDKSFDDIVKVVNKPLMCSHAGIRSVCDYDRNISDKQMKSIKELGGIIGITGCSFFINGTLKASLQEYIDHIKYAVDLIGIDCVGIGSDFEGMGKDVCPKGFHSIGDLDNLSDGLKKNGFNEEEIQKLFYKNAISFLKRTI